MSSSGAARWRTRSTSTTAAHAPGHSSAERRTDVLHRPADQARYSELEDRRVALGPPGLEAAPGEAPPLLGADEPVAVPTGDDEVGPTFRVGAHVLRLQVALARRGVSGDVDRDVAEQVLAPGQRGHRRSADLLDRLVPLEGAEALVLGHRALGEAGTQPVPVPVVDGRPVADTDRLDGAFVEQPL